MQFGVVPAHGPQFLAEALDQARAAERLGFDSVWVEEHHAAGPYWPTPLLALAALVPATERVTLGTNILILPLHDAVHTAEQVAVLDVMTGGRVILGVALGDNAAEFRAFRVDAARRGACFEEQIRLLRALWRGERVDTSEEFYRLRDVTLSVPPVQHGGPPIWVGGWGPKQLERAALLGDAWFAGPVSDLPGVIGRQASYDEHVRGLGEDPEARARPITRDVVVAATSAQAWEMAEREILPAYRRDYLASDHPLVGVGSGSTFEDLRQLALNRFIIGDPDAVTEQVIACIDAISATHFIFRLKLPGMSPSVIAGMLDLIGTSVLSQVRSSLSTGHDTPARTAVAHAGPGGTA